MSIFDYDVAFSRNIGWVTPEEQLKLKGATVAIAGAGGVGGAHLLTLCRLGINHFRISDFDSFELHNINRQAGALMSTLGQSKVSVVEQMAKDINPQLAIQSYPDGINDTNVDEFLHGADLYIDSLDFFAMKVRRLIFERCADKGIPVITAAPLGMGCAMLCFLPGFMSFEDYFGFNGLNEREQCVKFLAGLAPSMMQAAYLVDDSRVNFKEQEGPSTIIGVQLCAGMAATTALKVLLKRGDVIAAPYGLHFDAFRHKLKKTWRPLGHKGLFARFIFHYLNKRFR